MLTRGAMSGEPFDYSNERQRHENFVGREALLARLDALLVGDGADRWVGPRWTSSGGHC
jgi:hypothetical protein